MSLIRLGKSILLASFWGFVAFVGTANATVYEDARETDLFPSNGPVPFIIRSMEWVKTGEAKWVTANRAYGQAYAWCWAHGGNITATWDDLKYPHPYYQYVDVGVRCAVPY